MLPQGDVKNNAQSLHETHLFWVSLCFPVVLWLATSAVIWTAEDQWFKFELSASGFQTYYELYKLPLALLALVFPSVALANAIHRSKQMTETFHLQRKQTGLANYYQHRNDFEENCRRVLEQFNDAEWQPTLIPRVLYRSVYSDPMGEDFSMVPNFSGRIDRFHDALKRAKESIIDERDMMRGEQVSQGPTPALLSGVGGEVLVSSILVNAMCRYYEEPPNGTDIEFSYRQCIANLIAVDEISRHGERELLDLGFTINREILELHSWLDDYSEWHKLLSYDEEALSAERDMRKVGL